MTEMTKDSKARSLSVSSVKRVEAEMEASCMQGVARRPALRPGSETQTEFPTHPLLDSLRWVPGLNSHSEHAHHVKISLR